MTPAASGPAVDAHLHLFEAGIGIAGARYVPSYAACLDDWAAQARRVGIERGVLVQPSFLGTDNRHLLDHLRRHGDALRGVAVVPATARRADLEPLHAVGVRGIRLNLVGTHGTVLADWAAATMLWDVVLSIGWHVELHTDMGALPAAMASLPDALPLVIDHMGKPDRPDAADPTVVSVLARTRRSDVHVKLSGAYRLGGRDPRAIARVWLDLLGPDRLLWGSDWPCTNHEAAADYPDLLGQLVDWVGEGPCDGILRTNPGRLYWREGGDTSAGP